MSVYFCSILNYELAVQDVYARSTALIVSETKSLACLLDCHYRSELVSRSWIPDWTIPRNIAHPGFLDQLYPITKFRSSMGREAVVSWDKLLIAMSARGFFLDRLHILPSKSAGPSTPAIQANIDVGIDAKAWSTASFIVINEALLETQSYGSPKSCKLALWTTISATYKGRYLHLDNGELRLMREISEDEPRILGKLPEEILDIQPVDTVGHETQAELDPPLHVQAEALVHKEFTRQLQLGLQYFVTGKGYLGKEFSQEAEDGDIICILLGCPMPVVLREIGGHYEFIRCVYVEGFMFGEAMEHLDRGEFQLQDFEIH